MRTNHFFPLLFLMIFVLSSKAFAQENNIVPCFGTIQVPPEFPGGQSELMRFLKDNTHYPVEAVENREEGRVVVQFWIEADGKINDIQIFRSISPSLDAEAVRVVQSMPRWTPGSQRGQNVRVRVSLPITFTLPEIEEEIVVFYIVEQMPEFPGGHQALHRWLIENIHYPVIGTPTIQGRVIVQFTVLKTGEITDIAVVRGADPILNREAIRIVELMPRWIPGEQRGQKVNVRFTLPIHFSLW